MFKVFRRSKWRSLLLDRVVAIGRFGLLAVLVLLVAGCSLRVKEVSLSDRADYVWLGTFTSKPKTIYSVSDEQVALRIRLDPHFVVDPVFQVTWYGPDGGVFLSEETKPEGGNNHELIEVLPIRDNEPSRMPGRWRVEVHYEGKLLVKRSFRIEH